MIHRSCTTVRDAFYDVLRSYGIRTIFGNPSSTEETMLKNFPSDFKYVLGLQEASVVAMADGYAQTTRSPAVVSLHTVAGTGNGMASLVEAFLSKTPLIVIAGQQTREMLIGDPFLTNREATLLPQPWVKWAYQPVKATDVPQAIVRAIAMATMPPSGPVYLSVPLDDWNVPFDVASIPNPRIVSNRTGPDPEQLDYFVKEMRQSKKLVLVFGPEVDRSAGWSAGVALAEKLQVPVFQSPLADRAVFPETHKLFKGTLPSAQQPLTELINQYGFDLILVVGAEIWRFYPWIPGPVPKAKTLQITSDPHDAACALVGDTMLSDARLALEALYHALGGDLNTRTRQSRARKHRYQMNALPKKDTNRKFSSARMTAAEAFAAIAAKKPDDSILVYETPSNSADLLDAWQVDRPESCFTCIGPLGWGAPASVGIAMAQKAKRSKRPVVLVIGDGSFQYSVQSIYTAVREKVNLIYLVAVNEEYAVLKEFAELEDTPHVPGLDLPGLNAKALAQAYGCPAFRADDAQTLQTMFREALKRKGPTLIEFLIDRALEPIT